MEARRCWSRADLICIGCLGSLFAILLLNVWTAHSVLDGHLRRYNAARKQLDLRRAKRSSDAMKMPGPSVEKKYGSKKFIHFSTTMTGQGAGNFMQGLLAAHLLGLEFNRTVCVDWPEFWHVFDYSDAALASKADCDQVIADSTMTARQKLHMWNFANTGVNECHLFDTLASSTSVVLYSGNTYPGWRTDIPSNLFASYYQPKPILQKSLPTSFFSTVVHLRAPDGKADSNRGLDEESLNLLGRKLKGPSTYLVTNRVDFYQRFSNCCQWTFDKNWANKGIAHGALSIAWGVDGKKQKKPNNGKQKNGFDPSDTESVEQTVKLWADWYIMLQAKEVYHSNSDFSRSAVHWNADCTGYQLHGTTNGELSLVPAPYDATGKRIPPLSERARPDHVVNDDACTFMRNCLTGDYLGGNQNVNEERNSIRINSIKTHKGAERDPVKPQKENIDLTGFDLAAAKAIQKKLYGAGMIPEGVDTSKLLRKEVYRHSTNEMASIKKTDGVTKLSLDSRFIIFRGGGKGQGAGNHMQGMLAAFLLGLEYNRTVCVDYAAFQDAFEYAKANHGASCSRVLKSSSAHAATRFTMWNFADGVDECALTEALSAPYEFVVISANTYPGWRTEIPPNLFHENFRPKPSLLKHLTYKKPPDIVVHLRAPDGRADADRGLDEESLDALGRHLNGTAYLVTNRADYFKRFHECCGWTYDTNWNSKPIAHGAMDLVWGENGKPSSGKEAKSNSTSAEQNMKLWSDWYTMLDAKHVYHSNSDFSRSAAHWNANCTGHQLHGMKSITKVQEGKRIQVRELNLIRAPYDEVEVRVYPLSERTTSLTSHPYDDSCKFLRNCDQKGHKRPLQSVQAYGLNVQDPSGTMGREAVPAKVDLSFFENSEAKKKIIIFSGGGGGQGSGNHLQGLLAVFLFGMEFNRTVCVSWSDFLTAFEYKDPAQSRICEKALGLHLNKKAKNIPAMVMWNFGRPVDECKLVDILSSEDPVVQINGNTYPGCKNENRSLWISLLRGASHLSSLFPQGEPKFP